MNFQLDSRFRGNDSGGAGITMELAGMTVGSAGMTVKCQMSNVNCQLSNVNFAFCAFIMYNIIVSRTRSSTG
jgi:hypothetical protein